MVVVSRWIAVDYRSVAVFVFTAIAMQGFSSTPSNRNGSFYQLSASTGSFCDSQSVRQSGRFGFEIGALMMMDPECKKKHQNPDTWIRSKRSRKQVYITMTTMPRTRSAVLLLLLALSRTSAFVVQTRVNGSSASLSRTFSRPIESESATDITSPPSRNTFAAASLAVALTFSSAVALPCLAVSGGGLDFAGSDISGQDFSNGNYKGKDFTQGE
jgi:hypothetical protein